MKLFLYIAMVVPFLISMAAGATDPDPSWARQRGITGGKVIAGSISPDGKHGLYEFNFWDSHFPESATTATGIGLAPVDRSVLLYVVDSRTKWSTDKEVVSFLTVRWSGDSTLVATHDSGAKHSRLCIYRVSQSGAVSLDMPDLVKIASGKLGLEKDAVISSGQMPGRWIRPDLLEVSVRVTTAKGKMTAKTLLLVSGDGKVSTQ